MENTENLTITKELIEDYRNFLKVSHPPLSESETNKLLKKLFLEKVECCILECEVCDKEELLNVKEYLVSLI